MKSEWINGSDSMATNYVSGSGAWEGNTQVCANASRLYDVAVSPLAGMAANAFIWIFDAAAGSTASVAPKLVLKVLNGANATFSFPGGIPFSNGIYMALSSAAPTDNTTTATDPGDNKVIITFGYRQVGH